MLGFATAAGRRYPVMPIKSRDIVWADYSHDPWGYVVVTLEGDDYAKFLRKCVDIGDIDITGIQQG